MSEKNYWKRMGPGDGIIEDPIAAADSPLGIDTPGGTLHYRTPTEDGPDMNKGSNRIRI